MIMKTNVSKKQRAAFAGVLVLFLLLASVFCFAPQTKAAGNKKTMYLPVEIKEVESQEGSGKSTTLIKRSYSKKGLIKTSTVTYGYGGDDPATSKTEYKHFKNGAEKSSKNYYQGKLSETKEVTLNKKGKISKVKYYSVEDGKKRLTSTTTYKYNKKGKLTKTVDKGSDFTYTSTYYGNGNIKQMKKSEQYKYSDGLTTINTILKYDSHGNLTSNSSTTEAPGTENDSTTEEKITNTYNKKGDLIKAVSKCTDTYYEEGTKVKTTTKTVETRKYSYTKYGKVSKCVSKYTITIGGISSASSTTTTYKYKKFSVPKKLVPYAGYED